MLGPILLMIYTNKMRKTQDGDVRRNIKYKLVLQTRVVKIILMKMRCSDQALPPLQDELEPTLQVGDLYLSRDPVAKWEPSGVRLQNSLQVQC